MSVTEKELIVNSLSVISERFNSYIYFSPCGKMCLTTVLYNKNTVLSIPIAKKVGYSDTVTYQAALLPQKASFLKGFGIVL